METNDLPINYNDIASLDCLAPVSDWGYRSRDEAQCLLPGLYLSSKKVANSLPTLRALGITHIICVRSPAEQNYVKTPFIDPTSITDGGPSFQYLILEFDEKHTMRILDAFLAATKFCQNAWSTSSAGQPHKVLVYCLTGIEMGAAIAISVVMGATDMQCNDAIQWVKIRRRCISARNTYIRLLQEYEPFLRAQQVASLDSGMRRKRHTEEGDSDVSDDIEAYAPQAKIQARLQYG
jgi:serine/threonine/tyrosine-interacting protein